MYMSDIDMGKGKKENKKKKMGYDQQWVVLSPARSGVCDVFPSNCLDKC